MENKETFKMTYSAQQREEIDSIRKKYVPQELDKMARLRALDACAERKAAASAIAVGVIGTILMGAGMSLILSDFGAWLGAAAYPVGMALGMAGMAVLACAYPLYRRRLKKERTKIAPEILRLTDELMK